MEYQLKFRSAVLQNERTLWVKPPRDLAKCDTLVLFLDGEFYRDRVFAPRIIEDLQIRSLMRDSWIVYVSHLSLDARWVECPCYAPFAEFVAEELWQKLVGEFAPLAHSSKRVLIGLSYTGLAASYIALRYPGRFGTVVSQSGSYWWNDEWLSERFVIGRPQPSTRFYLDVGSQEASGDVHHRSDVYQKVSQISGVRRFRETLLNLGFYVEYSEFDGAHEMSGWAKSLPGLLSRAVPHQLQERMARSVMPRAAHEP